MFGSHVRQAVIPAVHDLLYPTQWGSGFHGGATDVAHLAMRTLTDCARVQYTSLAYLFVDVRCAFATVGRALFLHDVPPDEQWLSLLHQVGFSRDEIADICDAVQQLCLLQEHACSDHVAAIFRALHEKTWFNMDLVEGVSETTRGTAAGTAVADLAFTIAFRRVLKTVRTLLAAEGLVSEFAFPDDHEVFSSLLSDASFIAHDISYVDDSVFPVFAPASQLIPKLRRTCEVVHDQFMSHGLQVNYGAGKTEAICVWLGTGMSAARRDLVVDCSSRVRCHPRFGEAFDLRVVSAYKHLGTCMSSDGSMAPEVSLRAGMIRTERNKMRRRILTNPDASPRTRALLAQSFIFSRGLYNCSTWSMLTSAQAGKLHAATMQVYRDIAGETYDSSRRVATDAAVLRLVDCPPVTMLIRRARLLLFLRICAKRPLELCRSLAFAESASNSWLKLVASDFVWLSECNSESRLPCVALPDWCSFAQCHYRAARRAVLHACRDVKTGNASAWTKNLSHAQLDSKWDCELCDRSFPSKQRLGSHMANDHLCFRASRSYIDTTHCPACMLEFHTRDRLIRHLEDKSPRCRAFVLANLPRLEPAIVAGLDAAATESARSTPMRGRSRVWAEKPCFRLAGPTQMLPEDEKSRHPLGPNRRWL